MTRGTTFALVGATGGAGTTRLTVEFGATLARAGHDVALFDAAFATQGLARHAPGRIETDLTELLADDGVALAETLVDRRADLSGRLAVCPVRAPFERLARAKTPEAAQRFESVLSEATQQFEYVLVDTPPVAANQAVAAVSAADRVGLVVPTSERGLDRLPTMRDRLHDVGAPVDVVVGNGVEGEAPVESAAVTVPESETRAVADVPACADPDPAFAPAVADAVEACLDVRLELSFPDEGFLG